MLKVLSCITQEHDLRLLLVAVAICFFTALTSFVLAGDIRRLSALPQRRWTAIIAFVIASGIWSTHFIGMLAYQPHLPSAYSPFLTALSFLVCMAVCFAGLDASLAHPTSVPATVIADLVEADASQTTGRIFASREGRPPRRYYEVTARGEQALAEALGRFHFLRPFAVSLPAKEPT